jgi:anthranilate synthase component 2
MQLLILDNYDSFTFNLVHLVRYLGIEPEVRRNDKISLKEVGKFDKILLSPGPGIPVEAGIMMDLIRAYAPTKSIFGVCLGHQAIGEAFGGTLINLSAVYHGVVTPIALSGNEDPLFRGVPAQFNACRYHSWAVDHRGLPGCFQITAMSDDGCIMGLSHDTFDVKGVQFHPESFLTEHGETMLKNWIFA